MRSSRFILAVGFVLAVASSVTAQLDRLDADRDEGSRRFVTIRGCVDGVFLTATDVPDDGSALSVVRATPADRFRVVGDDDLIEELLQHSGHEVDITGMLLDETSTTQRAGFERSIGSRSRIWIGGARRPVVPNTSSIPTPRMDAAKLPEMEIRAVRHVSTRCAA